MFGMKKGKTKKQNTEKSVEQIKVPTYTEVHRTNVQDDSLADTLSKILSMAFANTSMTQTTDRLALLLKLYFKVDVVTLFTLCDNNWFSIIATNMNKSRIRETEVYYNNQVKNMYNDTMVRIVEGTNPNNYISASGMEYSNFTRLRCNDKIIGAVVLEHSKASEVEKNKEIVYSKLFDATALVFNHLIEVSNLIEMVSKDQLTGVFNRRYIDLTLQEELEAHRRLGQKFNIALMDIDFFKKFNDTYGHQFGDVVLQEVSKYMKDSLGEHSWVARYGGEEFLIFCARSETESFARKVDEIRIGISELIVNYGGVQANVTVSFGVSCFPKDACTVEEVLKCADDALYKSKETGRNRVTVY